jgi:hypothetical protein
LWFVFGALVASFLLALTGGTWLLAPAETYGWLQMLAGSSWPDWERLHPDRGLWFALGAAWHFGLNTLPLAAFALIVWQLVRVREALSVRDLIGLRDESIKNSLLGTLGAGLSDAEREALGARLDAAFARGAQFWEKEHLTRILPPDRAATWQRQPVA